MGEPIRRVYQVRSSDGAEQIIFEPVPGCEHLFNGNVPLTTQEAKLIEAAEKSIEPKSKALKPLPRFNKL